MKKSIFLFLAVLAAIPSSAAIRWLEKDYDFGLFKEIAGPKTGTSRFVNVGPDTVSIVDVKPSCGCTSSTYTETPLLPGDTAVIRYTYDPSMRPGKFEKSVRVTLSNGVKQIIRIRGNVLGTPESLSSLYPVEAGPIRLSEGVVSFGEVIRGRNPIAFVNAYVISTDSVSPTLVSSSKALSVTPSVDKAGPGDIITFTLNLNSKALDTYGPVEIPVEVSSGPTVRALAVIVPDVGDLMLHQQGKSPAADLGSSIIDAGDISRDAKPFDMEFTIANNGKAPLEIFRIYASTDAFDIIGFPSTVKAGKSAKIKLKVDPSRLNPGPQRQNIEIITNDPNRTRISLPVSIHLTQQ